MALQSRGFKQPPRPTRAQVIARRQKRRKEGPTTTKEPKPSARYGGETKPLPIEVRPRRAGKATELRHKAALVELGCMVCRRLFPGITPGPVELHHYRGDGWGKGDYLTLMPLCFEHHRGPSGVHGLGTRGFAKHYGFDQAELLAEALALVRNQTPC